jgi:hypothetical protein
VSPEVWTEVRPLIAATAATLGVMVAWPNEDAGPRPEPPAPWLAVDLVSNVSSRYELGANVWLEEGSIWIHLFIPNGTGVDWGLSARKAFSVAFRGAVPATAGLTYRDHSSDPLGPDDGVYKSLSLRVSYYFTDVLN